jgi:murein DD-endopeptidase MepM/ murein hydrolase activator NlpD
LPDPRRLFGRLSQSSLPTRAIAHLSVVSLVAAAGLAGVSGTAPTAADDGHFAGSAPLITVVYGAADPGEQLPPTHFDTRDASDAADETTGLLDRGTAAVVPGPSTSLPAPVPVDPDATPLPAPDSVGSTTASVGGVPATIRAPAPAPSALVWPVPAGSVSQYYHAGHLALDIAAPYGAQVSAAQSGVVTSAGWRNNGGGYVVAIDHGNGMITVYNHLGSIWVSAGQVVSAGQGIGGVGCTGMCTGPHVHFEVIVNGVIDNPLRYL